MKENVIKEKTFAFAVRIVKLYNYLKEQHQEYVISKQLLRSGTAIGALVREAQNAESKADFVHKMGITQKECDETRYWIELLAAVDLLTQAQYHDIHQAATELLKIIRAIILSVKHKT